MMFGRRRFKLPRLAVKDSCQWKSDWFLKCLSTQSKPLRLKIMFFGTDDFALESLKRLHEKYKSQNLSRLEVCCAKTKHLVPAVSKFSTTNNINIHVWPPDIKQGEFDLGVVASFGHLIPSKIIGKFPRGMLNVHGSILPKLRGAAPIIHALKEGFTETGVTIMKIKPKKFDIGDILAIERVPIEPQEVRPQLTHKMAVVGSELLLRVVDDLDAFEKVQVAQEEDEVTYAPAIDKSIAFLDFGRQTSTEIYNLWRGVGDLMKLRCRWKPTNCTTRFGVCLPPTVLDDLDLDHAFPSAEPGQAVLVRPSKRRKYLCVKCRDGWIAFQSIYHGTKKVMQPQDFANGFLGNQSVVVLGNQSKGDIKEIRLSAEYRFVKDNE